MSSTLEEPEKLSKWTRTTVGEAFNTVTGNTPSKSKSEYYGDFVPFVKPPELCDGEIRAAADNLSESGSDVARVLPPDSLLVSCIGNLGKIGIAKTQVAFNQQINAIKPALDRAIPRFMFFQALSPDFQEQLQSLSSGTTVPIVNKSKFNSVSIVLPPLPEQERIVAILEEAFEGIATAIAHAERNLHNARELFQSVLQSTFEQKGADWVECSLMELLDRKWIISHLDGNHGSNYPRKAEFIDSGVTYISANCIKNEEIGFANAKFLSAERAATLRKGIAQDRDVIFAHNATVGPVAILRTDEEKIILSTSLTYYRCDPDHILPEYLAHYMRSNGFKSQYLSVMQQSTRNQVPITKQREFFHVIPPIEQQRPIVQKLDALAAETRRLEALYQRKLDALAELKQSLLQRAFAGEL